MFGLGKAAKTFRSFARCFLSRLAGLADASLNGLDQLLRRSATQQDEGAGADDGADDEGQAHGIPGVLEAATNTLLEPTAGC